MHYKLVNNKLTKKTITPHALFTNKETIFTYKSVFNIVVTLEKLKNY